MHSKTNANFCQVSIIVSFLNCLHVQKIFVMNRSTAKRLIQFYVNQKKQQHKQRTFQQRKIIFFVLSTFFESERTYEAKGVKNTFDERFT